MAVKFRSSEEREEYRRSFYRKPVQIPPPDNREPADEHPDAD